MFDNIENFPSIPPKRESDFFPKTRSQDWLFDDVDLECCDVSSCKLYLVPLHVGRKKPENSEKKEEKKKIVKPKQKRKIEEIEDEEIEFSNDDEVTCAFCGV